MKNNLIHSKAKKLDIVKTRETKECFFCDKPQLPISGCIIKLGDDDVELCQNCIIQIMILSGVLGKFITEIFEADYFERIGAGVSFNEMALDNKNCDNCRKQKAMHIENGWYCYDCAVNIVELRKRRKAKSVHG